MGSFVGRFGAHFGPLWGSFWGLCCAVLESMLDPFGVLPGVLLVHFGARQPPIIPFQDFRPLRSGMQSCSCREFSCFLPCALVQLQRLRRTVDRRRHCAQTWFECMGSRGSIGTEHSGGQFDPRNPIHSNHVWRMFGSFLCVQLVSLTSASPGA